MKTGGCVLDAGGVVQERIKTGGRVVAAGSVEKERSSTGGGVAVAVCIAIERIKTTGCIADAGGEAEKRIIALSGVGAGIAAVRRRANCARYWRKRKADERAGKKNAAGFQPAR